MKSFASAAGSLPVLVQARARWDGVRERGVLAVELLRGKFGALVDVEGAEDDEGGGAVGTGWNNARAVEGFDVETRGKAAVWGELEGGDDARDATVTVGDVVAGDLGVDGVPLGVDANGAVGSDGELGSVRGSVEGERLGGGGGAELAGDAGLADGHVRRLAAGARRALAGRGTGGWRLSERGDGDQSALARGGDLERRRARQPRARGRRGREITGSARRARQRRFVALAARAVRPSSPRRTTSGTVCVGRGAGRWIVRVLFGESRATSTAERCKTGDEIFRLFARWYKVGIRRSCVTTKYVSAGTGPPDFRWRPKSSSRTSAASDLGARAISRRRPLDGSLSRHSPEAGSTSPPPSRPRPRERARVRIPPVPRVTRRRPAPRPRAIPARAPSLCCCYSSRSGADAPLVPLPHRSPPVRRRAQRR